MPLTHTNAFSKLDEIADTALVQLVYVSTLTLASRLNAAIFDEVEAHARDYNDQHGITGTLCYGNGHFLQCIEGEKAKVAALTQRIFVDSRHKDLQVLVLQVVKQRSFSDWRMRLLFLERWLWSPATKKQAAQLCRPICPLRRTVGQLSVPSSFCKLSKLLIPRPISKRQVLPIMRLAIWCAMSPRRIKPF